MRSFPVIARRELASFFYAPIAYVVGVAFLALNGLSFWALMKALSDPTLPAAPGAVLRNFFGGTMLHWLIVFAVVSLLSMRSVAEDRRSGLWEATLTTRASVVSVLLGKWCALLVFYIVLWLPTLGLIAILNLYLPAGAGMDFGPVVAAYVGVVAIGGALLAVGLAFSTATENQVVAAVGCFSVLLAWLMLGEVEVLTGALNLRAGLESAARGELRLDTALLMGTVTAVGLASALAVAAHGRHAWMPGWVRVAFLLAIGGSLVSLAGRHNRSLDLSAGRLNSLEPGTLRVLANLREPVQLTLVRPQEEVFDTVHEELRRLLVRMRSKQSLLSFDEIDPLADPGSIARWSFELAIRPEDFASGGAILVQRGERRRSVDLLAMASFATDDLGVGSLSELRAEQAIARAIVEVSEQRRETVCSSLGHGEMSSTAHGATLGESWARVAQRLQQDGVLLQELRDLNAQGLAGCDVLMLIGPSRNLSADEVLAVQGYRGRGGHLLVALRSRAVAGASLMPAAGLELLLEEAGVRVLDAFVVDPGTALDLPGAWMTYEGYGEHAIVAGFYERRATVWQAPRALVTTAKTAEVLVQASASGWGERSVSEIYEVDDPKKSTGDSDVTTVAVASENQAGIRLVAVGSAEAFSEYWSERGIGGNERLLVSSIHWLLKRDGALPADAGAGKRPERVRLLMSRGQLRNAFIWCVIVGPAFFALLGALLWWWRRREP